MGRENGCVIPSRGDRIELIRTGVKLRGQVWYADQLQMLVKWDNGASSSLRIGYESFRITASSKLDVKVKAREAASRVETETL